jgi:hypothetical protein
MMQKKIKDQEKKEMEEREKKAKANLKIMAKIAYKEWKEKKAEEKRIVRKQERLMRRQMMMEESPEREENSQYRKGEVLLAYGLNKNLKKIRERPKSAKPPKKSKGKKKEIHFS